MTDLVAGIDELASDVGSEASPLSALSVVSPPQPLRSALVPSDLYPHVRVVRDYATLTKIGRIRYEQYVLTQGKTYRSAVLDRDCLLELSDFTGVNVYATDGQAITAAMRVSHIVDPHHPRSALLVAAAGRHGIDVAISLLCSRLVKHPAYKISHAADLVRFVRYQTVAAGYRYCVMQTAPKLVPYFKRFQFYNSGTVVDDPDAGTLHIMILDTEFKRAQLRRLS